MQSPPQYGKQLADDLAVEEFRSTVKHYWDYMGNNLTQYVVNRTGVVGTHTNFDLMKPVVAHRRGPPQSEIPPSAVDGDRVECTMDVWTVAQYSDIFEQTKILVDERNELAKLQVRAMRERQDQIIIDAIDAGIKATGSKAKVLDKGTTAGALYVSQLLDAQEFLDDNNVPEGNRHVLLSAKARKGLLNEQKVTSFDYNSIKALVNGEVNSFLGFQFHLISKSQLDGLPETNNEKDVIIFHGDAIGCATAKDMNNEVSWETKHQSWYVVSTMKLGAVTREGVGCVRIKTA